MENLTNELEKRHPIFLHSHVCFSWDFSKLCVFKISYAFSMVLMAYIYKIMERGTPLNAQMLTSSNRGTYSSFGWNERNYLQYCLSRVIQKLLQEIPQSMRLMRFEAVSKIKWSSKVVKIIYFQRWTTGALQFEVQFFFLVCVRVLSNLII